MLSLLNNCKEFIVDWDSVLFALYYHDIIYKVPGSDNEEKSAKLATERMKSIGVPEKTISKSHDWILATKSHQPSTDNDCNLLLDADMAILGQSPDLYNTYRQNVRKEFSFYPDLLYNPGRKRYYKASLKWNASIILPNSPYLKNKPGTILVGNWKAYKKHVIIMYLRLVL